MKNRYPFPVSIITDEISQDPVVAMDLAVQQGLEGVELRSAWDRPVEQLPRPQQELLRDYAAERGLKISAIAPSFLKENWGTDDREKFARIVQACHFFGCTTFRGFSFWASDDYTDSAFAAYLAEYDALLNQEGLCLVLENDPSVNLRTGYDLARFFREHSFRSIGVLWDPGNDIYTCGNAVRPYPEEYQALCPFVRHIHIKDAVSVHGEGTGVALGDGWMDFEGQLLALHNDGYTGWITLEPHFRLEGQLDEALLRCPGGSAFSAGGYLPSRISMERLHAMLDKLFR